MNCQRYWMLLVQDCVEGYYAHPWAWDEIGFGGPAYPRGYMRLEHGQPEPWEVEERRYEWSGPPWSVTNEYTTHRRWAARPRRRARKAHINREWRISLTA